MEDAYVIGIRLGLDNAVSAGIATIRTDLMALDRAIAGTTANLRQLQNVSATVGIAANPAGIPTQPAPSPEIATEPAMPRVALPAAAIPAVTFQARQGQRSDQAPAFPAAAPNPAQTGIEARHPPAKPLQGAAPPPPPALPPPRASPPSQRALPVPPTGQIQAAPGPRPITIEIAPNRMIPEPSKPVAGSVSAHRPKAPEPPLRARARGLHDVAVAAAPARNGSTAIPIDPPTPFAPPSPYPTSSWPTAADRQRPQAAPTPAAPHAPQASPQPSGGDVFLDGTRLGHWIGTHLAREAGRPPSGNTGFDPRLGIAWPGTQQGG